MRVQPLAQHDLQVHQSSGCLSKCGSFRTLTRISEGRDTRCSVLKTSSSFPGASLHHRSNHLRSLVIFTQLRYLLGSYAGVKYLCSTEIFSCTVPFVVSSVANSVTKQSLQIHLCYLMQDHVRWCFLRLRMEGILKRCSAWSFPSEQMDSPSINGQLVTFPLTVDVFLKIQKKSNDKNKRTFPYQHQKLGM